LRNADATAKRSARRAACFKTFARSTLALAVACSAFWCANAQSPQSRKNPVQPPGSRTPSNPPPELTAIEGRLAAIEQTLNRTSIDARLADIRDAVDKLKPPSFLTTILPSGIAALAGLLGVLAGGLLNGRLQKALSDKQAKLQIGSAVIDWKLKQLSLLYGPLRALLGQSFGLYREMNTILLTRTDKFRYNPTGTDPDKKEFEVETSPGNWTRFRTVIHILEVYGKGFGVDTYFDEIVSIGSQMVKIIQEHAGYARPEEKDLMGVFGKYLAHYAVLKAVHEAAKANVAGQPGGTAGPATPTPPLQVNVSAAFPEVIHTLINQGFDALASDIEQWHQKAVA